MGDVGKTVAKVATFAGMALMTFATGGLATAGAAMVLAGSAISSYISYQEFKKAQRALQNQLNNLKNNGYLVNSRAPDKYVPIVYGTCRVGGNWIWVKTTDLLPGDTFLGKVINEAIPNGKLCVVMTLSEGEITSVDAIYLNGVELSQTPQASLVTWGYTTGTEIQTLPDFISSDFNDNIPYRALLAVQLIWHGDKWQTVPTITALVKGRKLYDPRTDTVAFSDNAALVALDYIRNKRYGLGIDDSRIDFTSFASAADYCDQLGFKFNGIIAEENRFEALENILRHFNGVLVRSAGIYKLKIQDLNYEPVVMSFNNDDVVAGSFRMNIPSIEDRINTVKVTFIDDELNYQSNTITVEDKDAVSIEPVREVEIPLAGANREHAIKIANQILKRAKLNRTITVTLSPRAMALEQGDVIKLTYDDFGINEKLFRVTSLSYNPDDTVTVSLLEEDYSLYDFSTSVVVGTYPITTLPDPYETPPAPDNLVVSEEAYQQKDGSWTTRLVVQFNEPLYGFSDYYEVWVQEDTGAKVHVANIGAVSPGNLVEYYYEQTKEGVNYTFYVKTVNVYGVKSVEVSDSIIATGKVVVPADVSFVAEKCYFRSTIHLEWQPSSEIKDLAYYEIRTDTNFGDSTNLIARTKDEFIDFDGAGFPQTSITFYIKARDTSGNWSSTAGSITLNNPIPADVSFITTACVFDKDIRLEWKPIAQIDDLDYYEIRTDTIWGNETNLVAQTKENYIILPGDKWNSSRSWTFYIKAKDTLGNWSINAGSVTVENAVPAAPTVSVENNFETIIVKWTPSTGGDIVKYEVDINGTVYDAGLALSYSFTGTGGTTYNISVRAVDICGPGNWSTAASITADDLQVTTLPEGYNLVQDWQFVNWPDSWDTYVNTERVTITDGIAGIYAIQNTAGKFALIRNLSDEQHLIPADLNKSYIAECYFRKISGTTGYAVLKIDFLDDSRTIYLGDARAIISPSTSGWQLARVTVQPGQYPSGTRWLRINCIVNWADLSTWTSAGDSQWQIQAPKLREVIEAAWIRDAAITEAKIADAAITNAKIADLAVDNAKISDLDGGKLHADSLISLAEGGKLVVGNDNVIIDSNTNDIIVAPDGGPSSQDYVRLYNGDITFYYWDGTQHTVYKSLKRIETGVASNGETVTIPGIFKTEPKVLLTPCIMQLYNAAYPNQSQTLRLNVSNLSGTNGVWSFTPIATLELANNLVTASYGTQVSNTSDGVPISITKTSEPNIVEATFNFKLKTYRSTGTSGVYYYRKIVCNFYYGTTLALTKTYYPGATLDWISCSETITMPAGQYDLKISATFYDSDGSNFTTTISYNYDTYNYSDTDINLQVISGGSIVTDEYNINYTPPSGWEIYQVDYQIDGEYVVGNSTFCWVKTLIGNYTLLYASSPENVVTTYTKTYTLSSLQPIYIQAYGSLGYSASNKLKNVYATIYIRSPVQVSTTPSNYLYLDSIVMKLATTSVLANGTVTWIAIGE